MRNETRTRKQIDANRIDLEVFRVIGAIDRFANDYRDAEAAEFALLIDGWRHRIRKHMHIADREATR